MWLMRDGRYFPLGDKFIPERWTENCPEEVKEKRVFIPFGLYVLPIIVYMIVRIELTTTVDHTSVSESSCH